MARGPKIYRAYYFRGVDPAITQIRTLINDKHASPSAVEKAGGPATSTLYNWIRGKTRRPQNATVEAAGRALGMKRVWVKHNGDKE